MKWNEIVLVTIKTTSHESRKEIIEVGLCNFDVKTLRRYDPISLFVKPMTTKVSEHCTRITGISPSDVVDAISFYELCAFMHEVYGTYDKPWASYGNFAEVVFRRQCEENGMMNPLSDRFINIRHMFPLVFAEDAEMPLRDALARLEIAAAGNSCEDDVLNTGILLAKVLRGGPLSERSTIYK